MKNHGRFWNSRPFTGMRTPSSEHDRPRHSPPSPTPSGITVDATPLILYFFIFATIYNAILLSTIALQDRKRWLEAEAENTSSASWYHAETNKTSSKKQSTPSWTPTTHQTWLKYSRSTTEAQTTQKQYLKDLTRQYPNLTVLEVPPEQSGQGKSAALNKAFTHLLSNSQFRNKTNWIIGVLDADGKVDDKILQKASHRFQDKKSEPSKFSSE